MHKVLTQLQAGLPCSAQLLQSSILKSSNFNKHRQHNGITLLTASLVWGSAVLPASLHQVCPRQNFREHWWHSNFCWRFALHLSQTQDQSDHAPCPLQSYFHQLMRPCPHSWKLKRWTDWPRDTWTDERKAIQRAACKRKLLKAQEQEWLFKMTIALLEVAAEKIGLLCFDPHLCLGTSFTNTPFNYFKVTLQPEWGF